jgi:hypothetical protein
VTDDDPLAGGDVQEAAGLSAAVDGEGDTAAASMLGAFDVDAIAAREVADVITGIIAGMTKEALERALTPERVELMQARAEAAVQRSFEEDSARTLVYGSADEWLRKYWRYTYRRRVSAKGQGTGRWRADWWTVDEAVQRIEALWRSWEASRLDAGLGISAWWITTPNHTWPPCYPQTDRSRERQTRTCRANRCLTGPRPSECSTPIFRSSRSGSSPSPKGIDLGNLLTSGPVPARGERARPARRIGGSRLPDQPPRHACEGAALHTDPFATSPASPRAGSLRRWGVGQWTGHAERCALGDVFSGADRLVADECACATRCGGR